MTAGELKAKKGFTAISYCLRTSLGNCEYSNIRNWLEKVKETSITLKRPAAVTIVNMTNTGFLCASPLPAVVQRLDELE